MFRNPLYRTAGKYILFYLLTIALCRVTKDIFAGVIVLLGIATALANKPGRALIFFLLLPFMGLINPMIFPRSITYMIITRLGGVIMTLSLIISSQHRVGRESLPLGMMGLYILISIISSTGGYSPKISYLKLLVFTQFLMAIYFGTRNLHNNPEELFELRSAFFAFCCIVILGSILVLPFPSIAYFTSLSGRIQHEGVEEAVSFYQTHHESLHLLSGILNHSQALAVVLPCCAGWVFADMVLVERRLARLHLVMLACSPFIAFMTRSRLGLLSFVVMLAMITLYCFPHMNVAAVLRGRVRALICVASILLIGVMTVLQIRNQAFSRLIRKTNDLGADTRTSIEAFTETRMGAIEMGLYDFHRNPIFGSGFQVAYYTPEALQTGRAKWYSAPIEKSLLPMIVLGESGIAGTIMFCLFLVVFYGTCMRKRYYVTISLFTVFLATNLGEGTFFAVSGIGGVVWILCAAGGLLLDFVAKEKVQVLELAPPPQIAEVTVDKKTGRRRIEPVGGGYYLG